jgi:hypothetical protein
MLSQFLTMTRIFNPIIPCYVIYFMFLNIEEVLFSALKEIYNLLISVPCSRHLQLFNHHLS